jgi:uncharacterized membrane protein YeaQ/YmgE (transglycosylase-associated protein family)
MDSSDAASHIAVVSIVRSPWRGGIGQRAEEQGMNVIIWLVVGGAMGWMAHRMMRTDGRQGAGPNVLVGVVGGLAGGWLLSPVVGADTADQHGLSLVVSFTGAMILLVMVNLIRQIAAGSD